MKLLKVIDFLLQNIKDVMDLDSSVQMRLLTQELTTLRAYCMAEHSVADTINHILTSLQVIREVVEKIQKDCCSKVELMSAHHDGLVIIGRHIHDLQLQLQKGPARA